MSHKAVVGPVEMWFKKKKKIQNFYKTIFTVHIIAWFNNFYFFVHFYVYRSVGLPFLDSPIDICTRRTNPFFDLVRLYTYVCIEIFHTRLNSLSITDTLETYSTRFIVLLDSERNEQRIGITTAGAVHTGRGCGNFFTRKKTPGRLLNFSGAEFSRVIVVSDGLSKLSVRLWMDIKSKRQRRRPKSRIQDAAKHSV